MITYQTRLQRQQGAVMIVTLLILLLLTMIGINAMQTNTQEEKMAGNMRNRNLAFEAAEAVLRESEQEFIENLVNTGNFTGNNGLYSEDNALPSDLFDHTTWTDAQSRSSNGTISGVFEQPRYMVQKVKKVNPQGQAGADLRIHNYGDNSTSEVATIFRITARGVGGSSKSQVILQSHYGIYGID